MVNFYYHHDGVRRHQVLFLQPQARRSLTLQIAVGSLYMFSVPRGYMDGFVQWCKQIIGLCLTTFLQATIITAGLLVLKDHAAAGPWPDAVGR